MADSIDLITHSPRETQEIGAQLGRLAQRGDVFLLIGELGSGKTCLTQGIARGLGIGDYATSPSFVIVTQYQGRFPLYHVDLYRLDHLEEVFELGLEDYFSGQGVCVVEWAEKGLSLMPQEHLLVSIYRLSSTRRRFRLQPQGVRYLDLVSQLGPVCPSRG